MKPLSIRFGLALSICLAVSQFASGQCNNVCTATSSGNIGTVTWSCTGTATAPTNACRVVIPSGFTVNINTNQTWNATVEVGGTLNLENQLCLGACNAATGCGYTIILNSSSAKLDQTGPGNNERLTICGQTVLSTNPTAPPSQQIPPGGFTGPTGWNENGQNSSLPVVLLSFKISKDGEAVKVEWSTISEENFQKFIIERSADGATFEEIGERTSARGGNTELISDYSFTDPLPLVGWNYYRLKAVDIDESFEYFGLKGVRVEAGRTVVAFPNPSDGKRIATQPNFQSVESDRVIITGPLGVEVYNGKASDILEFPTQLPSGIYLVQYISQGFEKTSRVMIKN